MGELTRRWEVAVSDARESACARVFQDRAEGGSVLAELLARYADEQPLVLGIARGGVSVASAVAERLGAQLDVIVGRKLGAPRQNELAIGAVTSDGTRVLNRRLIDMLRIAPSYLERVTARERAEARRREEMFRAERPVIAARGRVILLVDDGLATGATVRVCVQALRELGTRKLVVASPVGSVEACRELARHVDELVCPLRPDPFYAVGTHYCDFEQVSDQEVQLALRERAAARERAAEPVC